MLKFYFILFIYAVNCTFGTDINFCQRKYECQNKELSNICKLKHNCGVSPNCTEFSEAYLTDDEKQELVDKHNTLRNMQALGRGLKSANKEPYPTAANMRELVWNKELEFLAQCWANQCPQNHDSCRKMIDTTEVGQNLAWSANNAILDMTEKFFGECILANISIIDTFDSVEGGPRIGHFTQVIWAHTTQIGCGRSQFYVKERDELEYFLACNYAIAGNWIGEEVYVKGKPCSICPEDSECHPTYTGLCSTTPSEAAMPRTCKYAPEPDSCRSPFQAVQNQYELETEGSGEENNDDTYLDDRSGNENCIIERRMIVIGSTNPGKVSSCVTLDPRYAFR